MKKSLILSTLNLCMNVFGDEAVEPKYNNTVKVGPNEVSYEHMAECGSSVSTSYSYDINAKRHGFTLLGGHEFKVTTNGTLTPYAGGIILQSKGYRTGFPIVGYSYLERVHDNVSVGVTMETFLGIRDHNPTFLSVGTPIVLKMGEKKNYQVEAIPSTSVGFKGSQRVQQNGFSFKLGRSF